MLGSARRRRPSASSRRAAGLAPSPAMCSRRGTARQATTWTTPPSRTNQLQIALSLSSPREYRADVKALARVPEAPSAKKNSGNKREQLGPTTETCAQSCCKPASGGSPRRVRGRSRSILRRSKARVRAARHGQTLERLDEADTSQLLRERGHDGVLDVLELLCVIVVAPVLVHDVLLRLGEACLE